MLNSTARFQNEVYDAAARGNGVYDPYVDSVIAQSEKLAPINESWKQTLNFASNRVFGRDLGPGFVMNLESTTSPRLSRNMDRKLVLGVAGQGAVGKGSLFKAISATGVPKVVNCTTRMQRPGEVHGQDYYFFDSEEELLALHEQGKLLTLTPRPQRGLYGITRDEVGRVLNQSHTCVIEENPTTLGQVAQNLSAEHDFRMVYVLPPFPELSTAALRLYMRSSKDLVNCVGDRVVLDDKTIESTLGERQQEEFMDAIDAHREGVDVAFVVNDDLQRMSLLVVKGLIDVEQLKGKEVGGKY
jgi:guanylate kinase